MRTRLTFEYELRTIRTAALSLDYYLVPWDTTILGVPVAQIADVRVLEPRQAAADFTPFLDWCADQRIALCACRVPSDRIADSMFLEAHGFRFIELNYQPRTSGLETATFAPDLIQVRNADAKDREPLAKLAGEVFRHGRFHQDPLIEPALGDRRYSIWLDNAFEQPHQNVLTCTLEERIVGFFVVELHGTGHVHWSLNALAPGLQGHGLGKRVWRTMLERHRAEGAHTVSTSISSHNIAAFNLYVTLGFRFPAPTATLQWCPRGRITQTGLA